MTVLLQRAKPPLPGMAEEVFNQDRMRREYKNADWVCFVKSAGLG